MNHELYESRVLGVRVVGGTLSQVCELIESRLQKSVYTKPLFVTTVNPEFVMQAQKDPTFKDILNASDVPIADGHGLRLADPKLQIVAGRALVRALIEKRVWKVFYLGAAEGVAEKMAENYKIPNSKNHISNWDQGSADIKSHIQNPAGQEAHANERILKKINAYKPDILLVAYGAPWQEKWLSRHLDQLQAQVVIGVGGTFDYLVGKTKPPPQLVGTLGLEWLWRLLREPWRWRRQLQLVKYVWLVEKSKF